MRAVLIIDMPASCEQCRFSAFEVPDQSCGLNMKDIGGGEERDFKSYIPDWCPLRPLPDRRKSEDYRNQGKFAYGKYKGWNECLDEIEGRSNE